MSNGNGHRWSKFWWGDWQGDAALQSCSLAARGLWIELLGLCHASERVGYLLVNGDPPDDAQLADTLGRTTAKEVGKLLAELERRKVFSRTTEGVIFSRRMVKDAGRSEWGRDGAERRWKGKEPDSHPNGQPNGLPIGVGNGKPNVEAIGYPNAQKLEAEAEPEAEERKEVTNITSLSSYQLPARAHETWHETEPDDDETKLSRDDYDALHDVPTLAEIERARAAFAAELDPSGKVIRGVSDALRMELPRRPYGPVRSPAEQIALLNPQPEIADAAGLKWQPAEPVRTPAQQLAQLLSIPVEEAEARFATQSAA